MLFLFSICRQFNRIFELFWQKVACNFSKSFQETTRNLLLIWKLFNEFEWQQGAAIFCSKLKVTYIQITAPLGLRLTSFVVRCTKLRQIKLQFPTIKISIFGIFALDHECKRQKKFNLRFSLWQNSGLKFQNVMPLSFYHPTSVSIFHIFRWNEIGNT